MPTGVCGPFGTRFAELARGSLTWDARPPRVWQRRAEELPPRKQAVREGGSGMKLRNTALTVAGATGILCTALAMQVLWLLLNDPVTVATSVSDHRLGDMLVTLGRALGDALVSLLRYL